MHPANGAPGAPKGLKNVHWHPKKKKFKFFQKKVCGSKKGCIFAAAKNGNAGSERVHQKSCLAKSDWRVRKNFQKNFQKHCREQKRVLYLHPLSRRVCWERQKQKTSSLTYWIDSVAGWRKRRPAQKRTDHTRVPEH